MTLEKVVGNAVAPGRWSQPGKGLECSADESGLDPRGSRKSLIVNQCSETPRMVSLFSVS